MEFLLVPGIAHVSTRTVRFRDYTDSELVSRISCLKIGRFNERCYWCSGVRNHPGVHVFVGKFTTKKGGGRRRYTRDCGPQNLRRICYKAPWLRKRWNFLSEKRLHSFVELFSEVCSVDSQGLVGFYKGITASYFGISETVVHFVIYEAIKAKLMAYRSGQPTDSKSSRDFLEFMMAGAVSKTIASCIAYPHGKCLPRQY